MMNKTVLLITVSCVSLYTGGFCYADITHYHKPPTLLNAADTNSHNLHTSHFVAAHLSSLEDFNKGDNKNIQLAAACFVTDTSECSGNEFAGNNADDDNGGVPPGGGDDYELDDGKRCIEEGYTQTSCPQGSEPVNYCPYDNSYFEKCQANCPSNYVTCEPPYYGVGEACGDKYASCEKDTERACKEENPGYVDECGNGQQLSDDRCSYDNSYGICCDSCAGYPYTTDSIPNGYVQDGEACVDCDGNQKVKVKPNPCDGFMDCGNVGPEAGANTCLSGTETLYDNCKPCPNLGIYDSCPSTYTCTFEDCSNKYYPTGCQSGYIWNANNKTCTCDTSVYKYDCTGTDQKGSGQACDGKYKSCTCSNGKTWNGSECVCDSSYKYTCTGANESPSGTSCDGKYKSCSCSGPYEWDGSSCSCSYSYKYNCTGTNETGGLGTSCDGLYEQCSCTPPMEWGYDSWEHKTMCTCPSSYKYSCSGAGQKGGGTACNDMYTYCDCVNEYYTWDKYSQSCKCSTSSECDCQCNSATDCSNCKLPSYYNAQCTLTIDNGCGGKCQKWGTLDLTERTCKNADGQIVLTYYLWETASSYSTQVYCDGELAKSWISQPATLGPVQWGSVDWPAEKVWCNKEFDYFNGDYGSATVWNVEVDYNTEYCGGTASKVTVVTPKEGGCEY